MSAAITRSKIAGQSSRAQPCSVMSGYTPVAISWSIGADLLDGDAVALHDRDRAVGEPLGVRRLGRALERAVDVDGAEVGEVPARGRAELLLLGGGGGGGVTWPPAAAFPGLTA